MMSTTSTGSASSRPKWRNCMDQVRPLTSLAQDELIARIEQYVVVAELRDAEIRELHAANSALLAERDALLDQHHRDSKELRRLCAQRDAARKVSKEAGVVIAALKAERD